MSRRIRSIKPELLEDEKTAGLSDTAFRLFIGLITMADDFGTFRADARFIEKQVYWQAIPERGVATALLELESLVIFYTVRGQRYGQFRNWAKHQRVDNAAAKRFGNLPGPSESDEAAATRREPPRLAAGSDRIGSDLDRSGAEGGAPASAHVSDEEPEEQTGVRHVTSRPPPPADPPSEDHAAFLAKLRASPKLSDLDVVDLADQCVTRMQIGAKRDWVLSALDDANAKSQRGELSHVRHARVVSFVRNAKAPKRDPAAAKPPAHVESDVDANVERIRRGPKRLTFDDPRAAEVVTRLADGLGGLQAPSGPTSEAELADRARRDRERLAEDEARAEQLAKEKAG